MSYVDGRRKEILAKLDRLISSATASLKKAQINTNRVMRIHTEDAISVLDIITEARNKIERDGQL